MLSLVLAWKEPDMIAYIMRIIACEKIKSTGSCIFYKHLYTTMQVYSILAAPRETRYRCSSNQ